ncbi:MAG: ComEC family competence protein [Spirosomaceae bacterium]|nr:ComEC family competence protein [Spirosomataceae bacterium]
MKFHAFPFLRYVLLIILGIVAYIQTDFFDGLSGAIVFVCFGWILTYLNTPIHDLNHFLNSTEFSHYQAVIASNSESKAKTYKVEAQVNAIRTNEGWQKTKGRVLLYFDKKSSEKPIYGDVFLLKGMPREIEGPKNPFEFDYRRFMQFRGIYAHHFLYESDFVKVGNQPQNPILKFAYAANRYADSLFVKNIGTEQEYAIATAVVIGTRDYIDNDLLNAYSAAGAVHVLSVSGMHVAILFVVLQFLFRKIKNLKNGNLIFAAIVISLLWIYAIFTGLSSTVLRATVMFTIVQIAEVITRKGNIYNTLSVSAFILLCYNPYWVVDVGFQLSYLAIVGIVYLHPYLKTLISPTNPILKNIWEISCVSFSAQLATFPLGVYYFHQFPSYFLLANPFVFWLSELILPLGLFLLLFSWIPMIPESIGWCLKWILLGLNKVIFGVEAIPHSTMKGFAISITELLVIYAIIVLIIIFFRKSDLKHLKISLLCLIGLFGWNLFEDYQQNKQQQLTFHFIPRKSGISLIEGKSATFIGDSTLLQNPKIYDYHLKNYYDNYGISYKSFVDVAKYTNTNGMTIIEANGRRILWLRKPFRGKINGSVDYLLLSNNAIRKLHPAIQNMDFGQIIVDDSNKRYVVESLKNQADSLKINLISLYETGAVSMSKN